MDVLAEFRRAVRRPEAEIDLAVAALLIARAGDPDLDPRLCLAELDRFGRGVRDLSGLCRRLFGELGFRGDHEGYYTPDNSFLHRVVERRRGIPITLSLVTLEVGRRCGVGLDAIGMPGHFLLRDPRSGLFIDSFAGAVIDGPECERLFRRVTGAPGEVPFDAAQTPVVGPRQILARMLANLALVYRQAGRPADQEWALRMQLGVPGVPARQALELGQAIAAQGRLLEAALELEGRARAAPREVPELLAAARRLRARLN